MKIGDIDIGLGLVLAPVAGVTDLPFRSLCRRNGADLVYTELVSSAALTRNLERSARYFAMGREEHPVTAQIFGRDPGEMAEAAAILSAQGADLIDINMGCPVRKVIRSGAGAALVRDLPRARAIIRAVVAATPLPVTVKCRSGWDTESFSAVALARIAEEEGVSALALHPRTKKQGFGGRANWEHIRRVKKAVAIPIIGNGDVRDGDDAVRMLRKTGCDGIMIGRAAMGDPWVFNRIRAFLLHGSREALPEPETIKETFLEHLQMEIALCGERQGVLRMRKFGAWYTKGLPQSAGFRTRINGAVTESDCSREVETFFSRLSRGREVRTS